LLLIAAQVLQDEFRNKLVHYSCPVMASQLASKAR
jgi:hypothetical protein